MTLIAVVQCARNQFGGSVESVNVFGKVVQDSLPPLTLLLNRVFRFGVKGDSHSDTVWTVHKFDRPGSVSKGILNQFVGNDLGVRFSKVAQ